LSLKKEVETALFNACFGMDLSENQLTDYFKTLYYKSADKTLAEEA
jgi:hypothetical protein